MGMRTVIPYFWGSEYEIRSQFPGDWECKWEIDKPLKTSNHPGMPPDHSHLLWNPRCIMLFDATLTFEAFGSVQCRPLYVMIVSLQPGRHFNTLTWEPVKAQGLALK